MNLLTKDVEQCDMYVSVLHNVLDKVISVSGKNTSEHIQCKHSVQSLWCRCHLYYYYKNIQYLVILLVVKMSKHSEEFQ